MKYSRSLISAASTTRLVSFDMFGALCERDRACPRFTRMELHNHLSMVYQFNTADDALGRQILEFIRRGR
jgi:hypothetical protein